MSSTVTSMDKLAHIRAHPPLCPTLHSVTQHIQGLLFIAWDELLDEWPFIVDARQCYEAHTGNGDVTKRREVPDRDCTCCGNFKNLSKKHTHEVSCDEISNADVKNYLKDATESRRDVTSTDTMTLVILPYITVVNLAAVVGLRDPLWTHSLFSLDWLVWETLEYNLLVLTCSLKKALSTGIRLPWQGQLRLALSPFMSLYHSAFCLLTWSVFPHIFCATCYLWHV